MTKLRLWANLEMLVATIIWGSTFLVIKDCLVDVHAITLIFYRFALAGIILALIVKFLEKSFWHRLQEGFILGSLLFITFALQFISLYKVSATNTGFIFGSSVVFVSIFSVYFGYEKLNINLIISTILVFVGLWMITGSIAKFSWNGELLGFLSAITGAIYILYLGKIVKKHDIWVLNFQQFLVVTLISFAVIVFFKLPYTVSSVATVVRIIYLTVFATIIAYVIQVHVQKIMSPLTCTILLSLESVFAAIFAITLGGEKMMWGSIIGGMLIVIAIICSQISGIKSQN